MKGESLKPYLHHLEKTVPPSEEEGDFPREKETKILYKGTLADFKELMQKHGAELVKDRRLIDDFRFEARKKYAGGQLFKLENNLFKSGDDDYIKKAQAAFDLLGFEILDDEDHKDKDGFYARSPISLSQTTIRVRRDGDSYAFAAKRRLDENKNDQRQYENKPEMEVVLENPELLKAKFKEMGLTTESHRQKFRTSFRLKHGQLIELNESPELRVPFWLEIEGENYEKILEAAQALGFEEKDFFKGSDKDFMVKFGGLTKKETKQILY